MELSNDKLKALGFCLEPRDVSAEDMERMKTFVNSYTKGHLPSRLREWTKKKLSDDPQFLTDIHCLCVTTPDLQIAIRELYKIGQFNDILFLDVSAEELNAELQSGKPIDRLFQTENAGFPVWMRSSIQNWVSVVNKTPQIIKDSLRSTFNESSPVDGLLAALNPDWIPGPSGVLSGDLSVFSVLADRCNSIPQLYGLYELATKTPSLPHFGFEVMITRMESFTAGCLSELNNVMDTASSASRDNRVLNEQVKKLVQQRDELSEMVDGVAAKKAELFDEVQALKAEVDALKSQKDNLSSNVRQCEESCTEEKNRLRDEIRRLRLEIEACTSLNARQGIQAPPSSDELQKLQKKLEMSLAYEKAMAELIYYQFVEYRQPFIVDWSKTKQAPRNGASSTKLATSIFDFVGGKKYRKESTNIGPYIRGEVAEEFMKVADPTFVPPYVSPAHPAASASKAPAAAATKKPAKISRDQRVDLDVMFDVMGDMRAKFETGGFGVTISEEYTDILIPYLVSRGIETDDVLDITRDAGQSSKAKTPSYIISRNFSDTHSKYPDAIVIILVGNEPNVEPKTITKQMKARLPSSYNYTN